MDGQNVVEKFLAAFLEAGGAGFKRTETSCQQAGEGRTDGEVGLGRISLPQRKGKKEEIHENGRKNH